MKALLLAVLLAVSPEAASRAAAAPGRSALTVREAVARALMPTPPRSRSPGPRPTRSVAGARAVKSQLNPQFYVNTTPGWSTGAPLSVAGEVPAAAGRPDPDDCSTTRPSAATSCRRGRGWRVSEAALDDARAEVARRTAAACAKLVADEARVGSARRRLSAAGDDRAAGAGPGAGRPPHGARRRAGGARGGAGAAEALCGRVGSRPRPARAGEPRGAPAGHAAHRGRRSGPGRSRSRSRATPWRWPSPPTGSCARSPSRPMRSAQSAKLMAKLFKPSVMAEARYAFVPNAFGYDKYYLNFQENVASIGVSVVLPGADGRPGLGAGRAVARAPGAGGGRASPAREATWRSRSGRRRPGSTARGFRSVSPAAPWRWPERSSVRGPVARAGGQGRGRRGRPGAAVPFGGRGRAGASPAGTRWMPGCSCWRSREASLRRWAPSAPGGYRSPRRSRGGGNPPPGSRIIVNIAWSTDLL